MPKSILRTAPCKYCVYFEFLVGPARFVGCDEPPWVSVVAIAAALLPVLVIQAGKLKDLNVDYSLVSIFRIVLVPTTGGTADWAWPNWEKSSDSALRAEGLVTAQGRVWMYRVTIPFEAARKMHKDTDNFFVTVMTWSG
jgi:hypothetical protein